MESIPSWHSPDKSALMLLIRRGEKKWKEGGQRESAERKGRNQDTETTECINTSGDAAEAYRGVRQAGAKTER